MSRSTVFSEFFIVSLCFFQLLSFSAYAEDISRPHGITAGGLGTTVTIQDKTFNITGGTQKGGNLFHSFGKFNVHSGETARFGDPGIRNTIGRITGGEYSWINGILKSEAENLYLLNPGGFMFGSGATLDLKGSFHVSTADYLRMGDNERFYSKPMADDILSVAEPKDFGFLSDKSAKISVEGASLTMPYGSLSPSLSLISNNIEIRNSTLTAPEGKVIIGNGKIDMSDSHIRQDVGGSIVIRGGQFSAENTKFTVRTSDDDKSLIDIDADNIYLENCVLSYPVINDRGGGGDVILNAKESVLLSKSDIETYTSRTNIKDAGNVRISANSVSVKEGSTINTSTSNMGNGGNISLYAKDSVLFSDSRLFAGTVGREYGSGNAGKIMIEAPNISFTNGAYMVSGSMGKGNGGEITLKASESVLFAGENSDGQTSGIMTETYDKEEGAGSGGKLTIDAKNISFAGGAFINSNTEGKGRGGDVTLRAAQSVSFAGESSNADKSWIYLNSLDTEKGAGEAGKLKIEAENISFTNRAGISSNTLGKGKGGEVTLKAAESVMFAEESGIEIDTGDTEQGAGDAGKLLIDAKNISFTKGAGGISSITSGTGKGGEVTLKAAESVSFVDGGIWIASNYMEQGAGDAGKLLIDAKNISFTKGANISAATRGKGNGGDVTLKAEESVLFDGENSLAFNNEEYWSPTGIYMKSTVGAGDAGKLLIDAKNIFFTNGMGIYSSTNSKGKGSDVTLKAAESVLFAGEDNTGKSGGIEIYANYDYFGEAAVAGDAGKLTIDAKNIYFNDGTYINGFTTGKGKGGDIAIRATESVSFIGGNNSEFRWGGISIYTWDMEEGAGDAGKLSIDAKNLSFTGKAGINSGTYGKGNGGEVTLNISELITLSGTDSNGNSNSSFIKAGSYSDGENAGAGGKISVSAQKLSISDKGEINTSSNGGGQAGDIALNVGSLEMRDESSISSDATLSGGGRITVNAKDTVRLTDSSITTDVFSEAEKGGDITVGNPDAGEIPRFVVLNRSEIRANAYGYGDGGAVFIYTDHFLKSFGSIVEATSERGNEGTVRIEAPEEDVTGDLLFISADFIDAGKWLPVPCSQRTGRRSRFTINCRDSAPMPPDGCLGSPVFELNSEE